MTVPHRKGQILRVLPFSVVSDLRPFLGREEKYTLSFSRYCAEAIRPAAGSLPPHPAHPLPLEKDPILFPRSFFGGIHDDAFPQFPLFFTLFDLLIPPFVFEHSETHLGSDHSPSLLSSHWFPIFELVFFLPPLYYLFPCLHTLFYSLR